MKDKRSLQKNKDCFKKKDEKASSTADTNCEIPSCEDGDIYRQMYVFS